MNKILIISQYYKPEPFLVTDVASGLNEKGYEITVLTGMPNYPEGEIYPGYWPKKSCEKGITVLRVNARPRKKGKINLFLNYFSFAFRATLKVINLKKDYDVVYVYQLSPVFIAIPALIYKLKTKTKILLYCLDLWPQSLVAGGIKKDSFIYKIFLFISKLIYFKADKIQISSRSFKNYFKDELNMDRELSYSPQYANDLFLKVNSDENLGIDPNKINILFAGNIGEMQSIETLIEAMYITNIPELHLNIVGEGSNKKNLIKLVSDLNLGSNITFHGRKPIELMPQYYSESDALIVSLKKDKEISYTLPGKVQSYMASAKPIIGSIDGEAADVIKLSNCGLVSPSEDAQMLSENLQKFCNLKPEKRRDFGKNGFNYYKKNFTKEIFMDKLISDLEELSN